MVINLTIWTCLRCGHRWYARVPRRPSRCAKCRAINWWRRPYLTVRGKPLKWNWGKKGERHKSPFSHTPNSAVDANVAEQSTQTDSVLGTTDPGT